MVRWLVNGRVKDEEYEHNAGDVIENRYNFFDVNIRVCVLYARKLFFFFLILSGTINFICLISFNRLTLQPISRSDLGSNFTCEARNTDLVDAKETSISLDLNCK